MRSRRAGRIVAMAAKFALSRPAAGGVAPPMILRENGVVFRKDLIPLLLDNPMSVAQIARLVRESPRDVENDLLHLLKSLPHTEYLAVIEPARCRKCGFEFAAGKLTKPSKCPQCKGTWVREPRVAISTANRGEPGDHGRDLAV